MSERGSFDTQSIHIGGDPDPATGSRATPIHQTSSYVFRNADHAAALYALQAEGDVYSRISNPTTTTLETRLGALEGGEAAVVTASGLAAFDATTTVLAEAGDNVVSSSAIYGGTAAYLTHTARRRGIEARFVEAFDYDAFETAIDADTAYVHCETIGNPALVTPDLRRLADITHANDTPLVVDNTFATPALCRPLEHGADIVWESTTKWLHGAGTTVGGVVVDGGSFPWPDHPEKYPEVAADNPAFHGLNFAERFDSRAFAETVRHRAVRSIGHAQSPFDAWLTLQGVQTLPLRMRCHCENAMAVAAFLDDHPLVDWVRYPGLRSHPTHEEATSYLDGGYGGMLTFGLAGGYAAARSLCEAVELASFLANVGDAKTLIIHPASTTHAQLSAADQHGAGVTPDLVRLSVGLESIDDIIADLDQALRTVTGDTTPSVRR